MAKQNARPNRKPAPTKVSENYAPYAQEVAPYNSTPHRGSLSPIAVKRSFAFHKMRSDFGFSQEEFGRLVGMSTRKISSLENSKQSPSPEDFRRVNELSRLYAELSQIIEAGALPAWMKTPNEYFDGLSPMEVVQRGESDKIYRLAWRLQEGIPLD